LAGRMGPRIRTTQIKANMAASGRSPSYGGSKKNLSKSKSGKSVGLRALIEGGAKGGGLLGLGGLPARINILIVQGKPRGSGGLFGCFGDGKVYAEEQLELVGNENNPSSEFKLANRLRSVHLPVPPSPPASVRLDVPAWALHSCGSSACDPSFTPHHTPRVMPPQGQWVRGQYLLTVGHGRGHRPARLCVRQQGGFHLRQTIQCPHQVFAGRKSGDHSHIDAWVGGQRVADVVHRWRVQGGDRLAGGRVGL